MTLTFPSETRLSRQGWYYRILPFWAAEQQWMERVAFLPHLHGFVLCLRANTCGGIRCEVPASSGILFQPGDTQGGTFLWGVTQTQLWSGLLCVRAAMIPGSWGSWEAKPASTGPARALSSLTASCAEAGGLPQSHWEHQQAVQLPGTGFGTICHKSHGGRTQCAELLFPWQREGADKLLTLYKVW